MEVQGNCRDRERYSHVKNGKTESIWELKNVMTMKPTSPATRMIR